MKDVILKPVEQWRSYGISSDLTKIARISILFWPSNTKVYNYFLPWIKSYRKGESNGYLHRQNQRSSFPDNKGLNCPPPHMNNVVWPPSTASVVRFQKDHLVNIAVSHQYLSKIYMLLVCFLFCFYSCFLILCLLTSWNLYLRIPTFFLMSIEQGFGPTVFSSICNMHLINVLTAAFGTQTEIITMRSVGNTVSVHHLMFHHR